MLEPTLWRVDAHSLILSGELTAKTLLPLWQQKDALLDMVISINASDLNHVDSAGLALIFQFIGDADKKGNCLKITGVTDKLDTLMTVYNLKGMISDNLLP